MGPAPIRCAALLAVAAVVSAGCGGDESSSAVESAPASPIPSVAPSAPPTTTEPTTELTVVATIDTPGVGTTLVQPSLSRPSEGQLEQCGDVPIRDVEWVLDPAFPAPDATSTQIHVLVTERACASAEEMGDRLLGPEVELTGDAVRIAFAAIPPTGGQDCPSNPATSVIVELPEPLGERTVLDGLRVGPITDYVA